MTSVLTRLTATLALAFSLSISAKDIVHDGEYLFLKAQKVEQWAAQDASIDARI